MSTEASVIVKIICDRLGCVAYEDLLETLEVDEVENAFKSSELFTVIRQNDSRKILLTTKIRRCKTNDCREICTDVHLCKYELLGQCKNQGCKYSHSLKSEHNSRVLREHGLQDLNKPQLRVLLLLNDGSLLPNVCVSYNKGSGDFGNCPEKEECLRLHICEKYIRGWCDGTECNRSHDFYEPHPTKTLKARGVSIKLIGSLLQIYQNILTLKDHRYALDNPGARGRENPKVHRNKVKEICMSFIGGNCKYGDQCQRVHCGLPYKWQVEVDKVWFDLPDNEVIENDYCDPDKIHSSVGSEPVCYDTMMQGVHRVRRLSTTSSAIESRFIHTTKWCWYWENENYKWIQYGSIKKMDMLSSMTSEELEKNYLHFLEDNSHDVVKLTAGKECYELNFRVMKQRSEISNTETAVRRRPRFVSLIDVQTARTRNRGPNFSSRTGVPGFWDKTAIPKSGFQLVLLDPSHKDYIRVQEYFNRTMKDFSILTIKRVQNKQLWEDFQIKRERMKNANQHKKYREAEHLLFHGTNSRNIEAICQQNFDMSVSGANATMYGEGRYFARDATYSNDYIDHNSERVMFACRVLVGQYTKGAPHYRRPPAKDAFGNFYDSCVNDVRNPTIYVVFERSQVYPEFLITYEKTRIPYSHKHIQSSLFNDVRQTARSVTRPPYKANINTSDSASVEEMFCAERMPSALASPLTPDSLTESLNIFHEPLESEQSLHLKPTQSLASHIRKLKESDHGMGTSVTNTLLSSSDNAAKPSLTDNSIQSGAAKDQHLNLTFWSSNITERMSQEAPNSASTRSPFDKSISDSGDPFSCSSDIKAIDASSTTCFSEMESKTSVPCKSHSMSPWDSSRSFAPFYRYSTENFEVLDDITSSASPEEVSCASKLCQGSTGLSRKSAQVLLKSESVLYSSDSDNNLLMSVKPGAPDGSVSLNHRPNPELAVQQRYPQQDSSPRCRQVTDNFSHPLLSTSTCSTARNLSSDSFLPKESKLPMTYSIRNASSSSSGTPSGSKGSLSSSSISFNGRQAPSSALYSPPPDTARPRQETQQRKGLVQNEQKQKCMLQ